MVDITNLKLVDEGRRGSSPLSDKFYLFFEENGVIV